MSKETPETVTKYEVLFALRTGLTVLMPKTASLDPIDKTTPTFDVSPDNDQDIVIKAKRPILLKGLKKEHIKSSMDRGFVMIYETEDDEVVRNTIINYLKSK